MPSNKNSALIDFTQPDGVRLTVDENYNVRAYKASNSEEEDINTDAFIAKAFKEIEVSPSRKNDLSNKAEVQTDLVKQPDIFENILEAIQQKEFYDKELGENIKKSLTETIEKLSVPTGEEKQYFDPDLGKTIKDALTEAVVSISKFERQTIDLSPMIQIAREISEQNAAILLRLEKLVKPETNDAKYQELLKIILVAIAKNNEFMQKALKPVEAPVVKMEKTIPARWEFTTFRDKDGNLKTTADKVK